MDYRKINVYLGWFVFLIATAVYFITIEDTVSLWDCGEYITAAYKLEVGHPPGAPFFMVLGRLFSFFAEPENVAVWINRLSALSSSGTILFMFWSITILVKKMMLKTRQEFSSGDKIAIFGSGVIGSLAYAFTESFWFSAVEGEVYAMASLFTAIVFWAILKWDEEMGEIKHGIRDGFTASPDRWLIFIMFMLGLAIGVHLLGILVIPAITFIIYFRYSEKVDLKGIIIVGIISVFILGFIQEGVIPGSITLASKFEIFFVNSLGLPFYSGTIFFFLLVVGLLVYGMRYARKKGKKIMYSSFMGLVVLLIGYGAFAVIVIRSNANPPLDENNPENLVTLTSYLKREQYGSAPIFSGQAGWNAKRSEIEEEWEDQSPIHLRRFVVEQNGEALAAFIDESRAQTFAKNHAGAEINEKYFELNEKTRKNRIPTYSQSMMFPRMYWNNDLQQKRNPDGSIDWDWGPKVQAYKEWSGYDENEEKGTELGMDDKRLPSFGENVTYFMNYQVNFMYLRYFFWNFAGRQNDIQGHGGSNIGNWQSGFDFVDELRVGATGNDSPFYTNENKSNNAFFYLPLIFGLIGLFFHFYKSPKDAFVLMLAFIFTGLAIVVYLNQKPMEPRERDYAYAGSFYFFAMWIGVGVYALYESFRSFQKKDLVKMLVLMGMGTVFTFIVDLNVSEVSYPTTISWLVICAIGGGLMFLMNFMGKSLKEIHGAAGAGIIALCVPMILAYQGWDDHDRSLKTTAHDLAANYLKSCSKNGILFTNGDNDTFPLWYMQEVENFRTDVRVCNLSLMQTDWYTDQMKLRAYESDPLPIKFEEDQILMEYGNTDQVSFGDLFSMMRNKMIDDKLINKIIDMRLRGNAENMQAILTQGKASILVNLGTATPADSKTQKQLDYVKGVFSNDTLITTKSMRDRYDGLVFLFDALSGKKLTIPNVNQFEDAVMQFDDAWGGAFIADIMEFVRDDANLISVDRDGATRFFPTSIFLIPVNAENAAKSGLITKEEQSQCKDELRVKISGAGLTREEVMMLDIIANNDWKRGIFFSSPYGSTVSSSLYRQGCIRQNGLAYEISPLKPNPMEQRFGGSSINAEKMYNNLMTNYAFGQMDNPDVLTDYYARRHTSQYRQHFYVLAKYYLSMSQLDSVNVQSHRTRALNLIKKSLKIMPPELVIDYGEPNPLNDHYEYGDIKVQKFQDGILHEYVGILYALGENKLAEELANKVASQLESIFNYFAKSDSRLVLDDRTSQGLYSAMDAYFVLHSNVVMSNPESKLAARMDKKLDYLYSTYKSKFKAELDAADTEDGDASNRYEDMKNAAELHFELIGYHFGMIELPPPPSSGKRDQGPVGMQ